MDIDTQLESLKARLLEVDESLARYKGKGKEGEFDENTATFKLVKDEINANIIALQDQAFCRSIAMAMATDGSLLHKIQEEEEIARRDRELAMSLSGERRKKPQLAITGPPSPEDNHADDEMLARMAFLYISDEAGTALLEDKDEVVAESSVIATRRRAASKLSTRTCESCNYEFKLSHIIAAPCGHLYCTQCMAKIFKDAMQIEAYYPPRCCKKPISIEVVKIILPKDFATAFQSKVPELEAKDRTYCHVPTCSAFIPIHLIENEVGNCLDCGASTCTICKSEAHAGDCPSDTSTQQLLDVAVTEGWQRCYNCHRMVELRTGCHHITCHCKAEFCYRCGLKWKTCKCDDWEHERLQARATVLHEREQGSNAHAQSGFAREQAIRRIANHLRANHACGHDRWDYISGSHDCEECGHTLPQYIFQCRQCRILACWRCRKHRL